MKAISIILLGILLSPFFVSPTHAQESECDELLLDNLVAHNVAVYLFDEIARPEFDRQDFVIAIIVYSNTLIIEEDTCGIGTQARLLSWAFEVYRVKGNHAMGLIDDEQYITQQTMLFEMRDSLYTSYCGAYPISCHDGVPMSYQELVDKLNPQASNSVG